MRIKLTASRRISCSQYLTEGKGSRDVKVGRDG